MPRKIMFYNGVWYTYDNLPEESAVDVPRMMRHPHVVVEVLMVV